MKPRKDQYITRVETSKRGGYYWVRFLKKKNGKDYHEAQLTFTDLEYGDKETAYRTASKWRDEMMVKLGRSNAGTHTLGKRNKKARSNTGVVGVYKGAYLRVLDSGNLSEYHYYAAQFTVTEGSNRCAKTRSFSFDPSDPASQKRAFNKAKKIRREMEKLHYIN